MKILLFKSWAPLLLALFTYPAIAAILPHQGRVLVDGQPFDGIGYFRFALVSQSEEIRWTHEGKTAEPTTDLVIGVNHGFYQCKLGDVSVPGMDPLPDSLFLYDDPLSLKIWFSDGNSTLEELSPVQPLQIAPYAITTPWTKTDEIATLLSDELETQANDTGSTSTSLIERMISIASKSPKEDFDGLIPLSMLNDDLKNELDNLEEGINSTVSKDEFQDTEITSLEASISLVDESVSLVETNIDSIRIDITEIQNTSNNLGNRLTATENDITGIKSTNIGQTTDITSMKGDIERIDTANNDQSVQLLALGSVNDDQDLSITEIIVINTDQDTKISSVEEDIVDIQTEVENLEKKLLDAETEIDSLKQSLVEMNSTISAQLSTLDENVSFLHDRNVSTDMLVDQSVTQEKLSPTLLKYVQPHFVSLTSTSSPIADGDTVEITATFEGRFLSHQWQKDGSDIQDANKTTFKIEAFGTTDEGTYKVIATNDFGEAESQEVILQLSTP